MILGIEECKELCDWLMERGIGLDESACFLCDLICDDTFPLALLKVFQRRTQNKLEKIHDKEPMSDWDNPITP